MSTKLIIHEIEGMGFWVEIEETELRFLVSRYFLRSDGTLENDFCISPSRVVKAGLFKDKSSALLAANQYGGIKARDCGGWSVPITFNLTGGAA